MTNDSETPTVAEAFGRNDLFPEESLGRRLAELTKDAEPVAWGISVEDEMCDVYIDKNACVLEFERRNKFYPDIPRVLVELFTHPANTEAAIAAAPKQEK